MTSIQEWMNNTCMFCGKRHEGYCSEDSLGNLPHPKEGIMCENMTLTRLRALKVLIDMSRGEQPFLLAPGTQTPQTFRSGLDMSIVALLNSEIEQWEKREKLEDHANGGE